MASIIKKAFDAAKGIVRTEFLGKPNLFTTSDLNRQFEAIKFQLDSIEKRVGAFSDATITAEDLGSGNFRFKVAFSKLIINGIDFKNLLSSSTSFEVDGLEDNKNYYIVIVGSYYTTTYYSDPTHEISGAKFTDATSSPAANQITLRDVSLEITDSPDSITNDFCFVLARVLVDGGSGNTIITENFFSSSEESVLMSIESVAGRLYDHAYGHTASNMVKLKIKDLGAETYTDAEGNYVGIFNGNLVIKTKIGDSSVLYNTEYSPESTYWYELGIIRDNRILQYLEKYRTNGFGTHIDMGYCGTMYSNYMEGWQTSYFPLHLVVEYVTQIYKDGRPINVTPNWVVYVKMDRGITIDKSKIGENGETIPGDPYLDYITRLWPECSKDCKIIKDVFTFPLLAFV